jgi:hypothetical protein
MHLDRIVFNIFFVVLALALALVGAFQCFWPKKHRTLQDRFFRGDNPESPLGRMMERARGNGSGLLSRVSGLFLFCMMVVLLGWWILGHPALGR